MQHHWPSNIAKCIWFSTNQEKDRFTTSSSVLVIFGYVYKTMTDFFQYLDSHSRPNRFIFFCGGGGGGEGGGGVQRLIHDSESLAPIQGHRHDKANIYYYHSKVLMSKIHWHVA